MKIIIKRPLYYIIYQHDLLLKNKGISLLNKNQKVLTLSMCTSRFELLCRTIANARNSQGFQILQNTCHA